MPLMIFLPPGSTFPSSFFSSVPVGIDDILLVVVTVVWWFLISKHRKVEDRRCSLASVGACRDQPGWVTCGGQARPEDLVLWNLSWLWWMTFVLSKLLNSAFEFVQDASGSCLVLLL